MYNLIDISLWRNVMARQRVNEFSAESFTNSIGQILNPGDKVVAVTTGYGHRVNVFEGVFEGVYRGPEREGKHPITGTRVGQVPVNWNERVYSETGEHVETYFDWKLYKSVPTGRRYNLVPNTKYRKSFLQRNRVFKIDTPFTKVNL
jgi:hypothetical protein